VQVFRSVWTEPSELARTQLHARALAAHLSAVRDSLELVHIRDPWSAVPATAHPERRWRTVFEVNGLPSIEMPVRYENVGARTLARIRALEDHALAHSDLFVTPSQVTADLLRGRGVPLDRIVCVPNGADVPERRPIRPSDAPSRYILYFGAVQPWQGVDDALRAMARLTDLDIQLVIVSSVREKKCRHLARLARRLGIASRVVWRYQLPRAELV
jgi:glycosyltransferase involved in cell wall biosynthesis